MVRAGADDADGAIRHLEHALAIATDGGRASARCEALARLAIVAAGLVTNRPTGADGAETDGGLVALVERSAAQVREIQPLLPGHAPWGAQVAAAEATIAFRRGDVAEAATAAGAAFQALQAGLHEDASLEIVIPAARALLAGGPPDSQAFVRDYLQSTLSRIAQGTADETIRVRWLTGPVGRQLVELAGPVEERQPALDEAADSGVASSLDATDRHLLQLLTEGRTNAEIAAELDVAEQDVGRQLARLQAQLGASSRAEATSLAFRGLAAVGSR
jgi:DNA-binding NarL/FixJ family response regulator